MTNTNTKTIGFFKAEPGHPASSIDAAIQIGLVARHFDDGYMLIRGKGKFSIAEGLRQGILDEAGAAALAAHPNCVGAPPTPVALNTAPARRVSDFEGTPVGSLVAALQTWRRQPDAQENVTALGVALEAFQQAGREAA